MRASNGLFIVLEGSDGSGKTTQFKLLAERLRAAGHDVDTYDFPRYEQPSSYFVQRYLNGEYGPASEVSPYTASLFYALDRFEAAPLIRQSLADGKIALSNRYTGSNMAHQGSKFTSSGQQRGFFVWADSLEFQLLGIPRPTINIFLRLPAEAAYKLIKKKAVRGYTTRMHDEHEADIEHLRRSVSTYDSLCQLFPKDFKVIDCSRNSKILPVTEINNRIWDLLKPILPKPVRPGHTAVISLDERETAAPIQASVSETTNGLQSFEAKDISLLALNNLMNLGLDVQYELRWPPSRAKPRLNYYIPAQFSPKLTKSYRSTMDKLAELYHQMDRSLPNSAKKYLIHAVPLAVLVDAKIIGSLESFKHLLTQAQLSELAELRQVGRQLGDSNAKAKKGPREVLKEPATLQQIIKQLTERRMAANSADYEEPVKLLAVWPRNEMDLLVDCLYPHSNLGREEIAAEIDQWTYEQKADALKTICRQDAGLVLEKVQYRFDVIADQPTLKKVAELLKSTELQLQPPTPRYGYQVPNEIEAAGIDEAFIKSFDLSLELYSAIQADGQESLAGYAVLLGHHQRWQFSSNGKTIFRSDFKQPADISNILEQLREKVAEAHPLISQAVRIRPEARKSSQQPRQSAKAIAPKRSPKKRRSQPKK